MTQESACSAFSLMGVQGEIGPCPEVSLEEQELIGALRGPWEAQFSDWSVMSYRPKKKVILQSRCT